MTTPSLSITCFTTRETVSGKSVSPPVKRSAGWFGRIPGCVGLDLGISDAALRIYVLLALQTFRGTASSIGMRELGNRTNTSPATVMRRLRELEKAGHIRTVKTANGKRSWYELTSPVFAERKNSGLLQDRKHVVKPTVSRTIRQARYFAEDQERRERGLTA